MLYGGISPAGTVNLITKKPIYGSFNKQRLAKSAPLDLSRGTFLTPTALVGQSDNVLACGINVCFANHRQLP